MKTKRNTYPDELTKKMHSEFGADRETERKHKTWTALGVIASRFMNKVEAMEKYGVTEEDFTKYTPEWENLSF